jgi:hypothetical protein
MTKENKASTITIDDVEHDIESMTDQQKAMINHIADLDRKIGTTQFNLDQLAVGKQAFVGMLKESLTTAEEA